MNRIPLFDAKREFEALAPDLEGAALRVLRSGRYILGPEVAAFEDEVATFLGSPAAVSCGNGTDALWLALRALDVGPGDLVIVPAFTFFATASAVCTTGAKPVLCDIDPLTFNLDPEALRTLIEHRSDDRITAIVPVHLFGRPAAMAEIGSIANEHGIPVVEDAAQAFGAELDGRPAGSFGAAGCFSFFPTKNLGGFGDGGLITTTDDAIATKLRLLRAHGSQRRYIHEIVGTNSRLDELHAAMLRVRLAGIGSALGARRAVAAAYDRALRGSVECPVPEPGHSYNLYVVRVSSGRDDLRGALEGAGIDSGVYYPLPLHEQPALKDLGNAVGDFPGSERACKEALALPMFPGLTESEIGRVCEVVNAWAERSA